MSKFVTPDIGDTYFDMQVNRKWRLTHIREDGVCMWTRVNNTPPNPDDEWYTDTFGYRTTFHGKRMVPEQWVFDPNEAPVEVSTPAILTRDSVGSEFVDNKGDVWQCLDFEGGTYGMQRVLPMTSGIYQMRVLSNGFPVSNVMPKQWTRRIVAAIPADEELVERAMEVEASHPDMVAQQQAAERADAFDPGRAADGVQSIVTQDALKANPEKINGGTLRLDLLPLEALQMVQSLLVDPTKLAVHEHLGVKAERFYLAHSICAQLFRLDRLIKEMD